MMMMVILTMLYDENDDVNYCLCHDDCYCSIFCMLSVA